MALRTVVATTLSLLTLISSIAVTASPASANQPRSSAGGPDEVYFPDTGQYLEGDFLDFWWEYGGVPVFGFPVSGEFEQDGMTVQYFERAVLESHPDNPPEWQILLRRLGAEAATPDVRQNPAFDAHEPVDIGRYFPETQQNLVFGFLDHWERNGGIRIFGYPISQEFVQDGFTVQFFERAIFEYHPDNPPEWRILQPLIGAAAAREDGVDRSPKPHDERVPIYHPNLWKQNDRVVYLTFDDGPHPTWTPQILDTLDRHNARATFFVLGMYANEHPGIIDDIASRGHGIGNHSYDHASMAGMSFDRFQWQVRATEQAARGHMSNCLRPPYGATDVNTQSFAGQLGYQLTMWDVDPRDWQTPGANVIADRVVNNVSPGSIVLLHDGGGNRSQTVAALDSILSRLSADGYRFEAICR